ncbi:3-methyl-2-oxobutanoate hydroxymethyltransferase [Pelagibacteraceae bacterium]|nr:3-methyl-2-oxobutanoate hydroxymethyltransferase [Pelagibacteraceae bacterium]
MHKKYKRVFSINNDLGYRNYTVRDIIELKGKKKLSQVRVTSPQEAAAAEEAGIDLLLTGPGPELPKIRKAAAKTFMTVGVPFIDNPSKREATKKVFEIIEAGADSLMCQNWNLDWMTHLSKFRIPFQSHVGFIPRRTTWIGGIRSFGKTAKEAMELFKDIKDIENTGAWGIEVELVPENILAEITKMTSLVTISIGSGNAADAQFLFAEDILGQSQIKFPKHAKQYANFDKLMQNLQKERINAFKEFKSDVKKNKFPTKKHSISLENKELINFRKFLHNQKVNI